MSGASEDTLRELLMVAQSTNANMLVLSRLINNMSATGGGTRSAADATRELGIVAKGANLALGGLRVAAAAAGAALGAMTSVLGKTVGVIAETSKRLYSFSEVAADGRATISEFLKSFSNLPFFIGSLFGFAGEIYKIQEGMLSSYLDMTKVGASFSGSLVQMNQTAMRAGVTLGELTKFTRDYSKVLATAIGGVDGGLKKFAEVQNLLTGPNSEYAKNLFGLGFTVEDVTDTLGMYLAVQGDMSKIQLRDNKKIAESINAYATELDFITKLTGKNREEEQQKTKALALDNAFQFFIQKFPDDVKKQFLLAINLAGQLGGKGFADIIKQSIMTGGTWVPVTDEMKAVTVGIGGQMQNVVSMMMQLANSTNMSASARSEMIVKIASTMGTAFKQNVMDPMGNMGPLLNMTNHSLFTNSEMYRTMILAGKGEIELKKFANNMTKAQLDQAGKDAAKLQEQQRALVRLGQTIQNLLVSAFGPFATSMERFAIDAIKFVIPHLIDLGKWFRTTFDELKKAYTGGGLAGLLNAIFKTAGNVLINNFNILKSAFQELKPALLKIWDKLLPVLEAMFSLAATRIWQAVTDKLNPFSAARKLERLEEIEEKKRLGEPLSVGDQLYERLHGKDKEKLKEELLQRERENQKLFDSIVTRNREKMAAIRREQGLLAPQRTSTSTPSYAALAQNSEQEVLAREAARELGAPPPPAQTQVASAGTDSWGQLGKMIETLVVVNKRVEENTKETVRVVKNLSRDRFQYS